MKRLFPLFLIPVFLLGGGFLRCQEPGAQEPSRLKREDCFLGIHFDFHATADDRNIGLTVTEEMVEEIIDMIGPDYIQVDTKGHPGIASFPTRYANRCEHIAADQLRVWRKVTKRRGVPLLAHYSGILDTEAGKKHPQWQAVNSDGGYCPAVMSAAGPYADELMIPQLIELGKEYGLDGVWVDGDCWAARRDWTPSIQEEFTRATGIESVPTDPSDPNWHEWSQFQRRLYHEYLRHCGSAVKKEVPGFVYCSNWAYSHMMPEPPGDEVDFLSGDFSTAAGPGPIDHARFLARFFAGQGKPWDLMAWSGLRPDALKSAVQLEREAACVLSQGGGFEVCFLQNRDGSVQIDNLRAYAEAAGFCRQRQKYAFKGEVIPQTAVLLSTEGSYSRWDREGRPLFDGDFHLGDSICATLLNHQLPISVLTTKNLMDQMERFPLIVVYQWETLEPELIGKLREYVSGGGRLLLAGSHMRELFGEMIGAAGWGRPAGHGVSVFDLKSGNFALIDQDGAPEEAILTAVDILFTNRRIAVEGNPPVDLTLTHTAGGETAVHLINTTPPEGGAELYDKIDPVGPVKIFVRLEEAPKAVTLQPEGTPLQWHFSNGIAAVTVPSVPIYQIVVIEEAKRE